MLRFIAHRFAIAVVTLFIISILVFVIIQLPPGDFLTLYLSNMAARGIPAESTVIEGYRRLYGLDQPPHVQYMRWMAGMARGDLGMSFAMRRPVRDLIAERLPMTIIVSTGSLMFIYLLAVPLGVVAAVKQYSPVDYAGTFVSFVGLSVPNFLLALVLMFAFYHWLGISVGGLFSREFMHAPWSWARVVDLLQHLMVPIIVIGTAGTARIFRIMRAMTLDELSKDYVKMARSKGLSEFRVIVRHPVRVALNPIISTVGWELPNVISGEAITAVVLSLPTTGVLLLSALQQQDMYLAGSFLFILSALIIVGTFLSDLLLMALDPRVRSDHASGV